jgi:DNA-binding SARP family transcriptional activator
MRHRMPSSPGDAGRRTEAPATWNIYTFGCLRLLHGGHPYGERLSRHSKALIGLLVLRRGRNVRREEIVDALWSADYDKEHQRRLSTILWRLKNASDRDGRGIHVSMLHVDRNGDVRIEPDAYTWIDLAEFDSILHGVPVPPRDLGLYDLKLIEKAVALYRGDLLQDVDAQWAAETRDHARQCCLDMLQILIEHYARTQQLDKVAAYAERFIEIDPYVDNVHLALINAYLLGGRRALAASRAARCQRLIVDDLGIALTPEINTLLTALLPNRSARPPRDVLSVRSRRRRDSIEPLLSSLFRLRTTCMALLDELQKIDAAR